MRIVIILVLILIISSDLFSDEFLGVDKVAHFTGSAFVTCWAGKYSETAMNLSSDESRFFGAGVSISLGLLKESNDHFLWNGEWGWYDIFWDIAGIGCGLILLNNGI